MAAAIIGNLIVESGSTSLPTHADNGIGYHGIAQWGTADETGRRWQAEGAFAKTVPGSRYELNVQLEFIQYEMNNNPTYEYACKKIRAVAKTGDVRRTALSVTRYYEQAVKPNGHLQAAGRRVVAARGVFRAYQAGEYG
jgi:hypothetical protein